MVSWGLRGSKRKPRSCGLCPRCLGCLWEPEREERWWMPDMGPLYCLLALYCTVAMLRVRGVNFLCGHVLYCYQNQFFNFFLLTRQIVRHMAGNIEWRQCYYSNMIMKMLAQSMKAPSDTHSHVVRTWGFMNGLLFRNAGREVWKYSCKLCGWTVTLYQQEIERITYTCWFAWRLLVTLVAILHLKSRWVVGPIFPPSAPSLVQRWPTCTRVLDRTLAEIDCMQPTGAIYRHNCCSVRTLILPSIYITQNQAVLTCQLHVAMIKVEWFRCRIRKNKPSTLEHLLGFGMLSKVGWTIQSIMVLIDLSGYMLCSGTVVGQLTRHLRLITQTSQLWNYWSSL